MQAIGAALKSVGELLKTLAAGVGLVASLLAIYAYFNPNDAQAVLNGAFDALKEAQESLDEIEDNTGQTAINTERTAGNTDLLAAAIPQWFDVTLQATATGPNAFNRDAAVQQTWHVHLKNETNFPIRVTEVAVRNVQGEATGDTGYVITARSIDTVRVVHGMERETTLCVVGRLQDGTFLKEERDIELTAPPPSPRDMMGFMEFGVRILDQRFEAQAGEIGC